MDVLDLLVLHLETVALKHLINFSKPGTFYRICTVHMSLIQLTLAQLSYNFWRINLSFM